MVAIGAAPYSLNAQQSSESKIPSNIEQIIVTGTPFQSSLVNRLDIELEELPYSLEIISSDFIEQTGFIRPLESLTFLPNVVSRGDEFSSGGISFLVRGFDADILINNRPEASSRGFGRRDSSAIERYEVLKGPASISLGPVLPGGIINAVAKLPQQGETFSDAELRVNNFGTTRGEFDINAGNLLGSDIVGGRLTLAYENSEFENNIENREFFTIRPVISLDFSSRTRAYISLAYKDFNATPNLNFAIFQDGTIPTSFATDTFFGPFDGVGSEGDDLLVDAEVQHSFLDNLKLTVRGSIQDTNLDYANTQGLYNYNFDEGAFGIAPSNPVGNFYSSTGSFDEAVDYLDVQLAWSNLRVARENGLDVVLGATLQETDGLSTFFFDGFNGIFDVLDFDPSTIPTPVNTGEPTPFFDFTTTTESVYAEAIFRPTNWVTIVGGMRYDDLVNELRDPTSGGDDIAEDDFVQITTEETDNTSFRLGATFHINDSINLYASFAESFVPQSGVLRSGAPIGPETAESFEIGAKIALSDRFSLTAAIFDTTRQGVANSDPENTPEEAFVVAAGEQVHRGAELGFSGQILSGWDINANYGYLDAEFTESFEGLEGLRPTEAPDNTFSLVSSYKVQSGALEDLSFGAGVRYIDDRPGATGGTFDFDGYTLVDTFVSYPFTDSVEATLNLNNLTDEVFLESIGNSGRASGGSSFGEARTLLLTLKVGLF